MRAKDNGDKLVCANNLLATIRGEVAYDRLRGLEARNFDLPYGVAETEIQQDAAWVLGIYEPRAEVERIEITQEANGHGDFGVKAIIK